MNKSDDYKKESSELKIEKNIVDGIIIENYIDPFSLKIMKSISRFEDGRFVSWMEYEYDSVSGNIIKETSFTSGGNKSIEREYDPVSRDLIKVTDYDFGKLMEEKKYDPDTGNLVLETHYHMWAKQEEFEYDPNSGNRI